MSSDLQELRVEVDLSARSGNWEELDRIARTTRDMLNGQPSDCVELSEHVLAALHEREEEPLREGELRQIEFLRDTFEALHLEACELIGPEPGDLAERLAAWKLDSELMTFAAAPDSYADVLGKAGLARYDELSREPWLPASISPESHARRGPGERFEVSLRLGPMTPSA